MTSPISSSARSLNEILKLLEICGFRNIAMELPCEDKRIVQSEDSTPYVQIGTHRVGSFSIAIYASPNGDLHDSQGSLVSKMTRMILLKPFIWLPNSGLNITVEGELDGSFLALVQFLMLRWLTRKNIKDHVVQVDNVEDLVAGLYDISNSAGWKSRKAEQEKKMNALSKSLVISDNSERTERNHRANGDTYFGLTVEELERGNEFKGPESAIHIAPQESMYLENIEDLAPFNDAREFPTTGKIGSIDRTVIGAQDPPASAKPRTIIPPALMKLRENMSPGLLSFLGDLKDLDSIEMEPKGWYVGNLGIKIGIYNDTTVYKGCHIFGAYTNKKHRGQEADFDVRVYNPQQTQWRNNDFNDFNDFLWGLGRPAKATLELPFAGLRNWNDLIAMFKYYLLLITETDFNRVDGQSIKYDDNFRDTLQVICGRLQTRAKIASFQRKTPSVTHPPSIQVTAQSSFTGTKRAGRHNQGGGYGYGGHTGHGGYGMSGPPYMQGPLKYAWRWRRWRIWKA